MIKKDAKGLTLLELLVAMSIFTIVMFIGYKIINQSTKSVKDQGNINKGQLTMNDMNEYLTNDLEQATSVRLLLDDIEIADTTADDDSDDKENLLSSKIEDIKNSLELNNEISYDYEIRFSNDAKASYGAKYNVTIRKKMQNKLYTISRIDRNSVKISFIEDEILKGEELPFVIEGNSPYRVSLGYSGKENQFNNYNFLVTSRISDIVTSINPEPPVTPLPPEIEDIVPPSDWGNYNAIGFWTADSQKKKDDNLYTWVSSKGTMLGHAYADQNISKKETFNIEGYARPGNNEDTGSYIGYRSIASDLEWKGQVNNVYIGDKDISKVSIYISPYTSLEKFNITSTQGNATIEVPELKPGWNHCIIKKNGNSKVNFILNGELSIDKSKVSSGYAYVIYERGNSYSLQGDIIYKWETQGNKYNVEAYANVGSDKKKRNEEQYNENRNMSIQIDKGSSTTIVRARGLDSEIATSDEIFRKIKAIKISIEGKLILKDIQFNDKSIHNLNNGNPSVILELDNNKMSNELKANFNFSNMKNNKDSGNLIIDFIY